MLDFGDYCGRIAQCFNTLRQSEAECERAASILVDALKKGNKVIFCGNGGSAADSQHLATELTGRFLFDRDPLPALSLTVDTSALTAIGNDYGYGTIFSRQLRGIGKRGDVLVGLSTSGNSQNVVDAIRVAQEMDITTIGLTGTKGGRMTDICDVCIRVPSEASNHIQEMHIAVGHWLCGIVEERMCKPRTNEIKDTVRAA
ncbi:MAG: D-sedoheptulose 7-phosphate isomerase [Alphaproteobacteria bacterium]|nr:D-sedoheptulose 7-phosphate isomerase [Alphaproteobacteria bacterium]